MHILSSENGKSRFKVLLWFLLLFIAVHVGIKLVPMYMDYARMDDTMRMKASVAQVLKDEEILHDLVNRAKELDLPLGPESFIIRRDEERRKMKISTSWDVEVHFFWDICGAYCIKKYHFAPSVDENIMSVNR